jgi:selenocysteine lyase/cysteine desulfurase
VAVHDGPPDGPALSAIITFTVDGVPARAAVAALARARPRPILVHASGPASSARSFGARGLSARGGVVRASFHYYNTDEEVGALVEAVRGIRRSDG